MKTVQMISANGGAEIEVNDDRVEHFERKGYRLVDAKAPAPGGQYSLPHAHRHR